MHRFLLLFTGLLATPAFATPKVVTDIAPVHSLVAMVMGDIATPELLMTGNADPHDFQLRPSQARALAEAGLVIRTGPEMSPWLDRAYTGIGAKAPMLSLLDAPGTHLRDFADGEEEAGMTDGHDHSHDHDHDRGATDPHAWLDPHNAALWLPVIAAELSGLDPENAATYAANATAGQAGIERLEAELAIKLAPVAGKAFVTFHDAYGYFTAHFGLKTAGTIRMGDAAAPGAAHLSQLQADLRQGDVVCLFPEVNHNPAQAAQLIEGTTTRLGGALDPAGVVPPPGPALYDALMHGLADTLADCLATR